MKKFLEITGMLLFIAGLILIMNAQFLLKTTVLSDVYTEVNNIGLIADKLNYTILGGIMAIIGLQLILNEDSKN